MTDVHMMTIIARSVPWPERAGLRLRWDALTEDGEVLVEATEFPLSDAAHVLMSRGLDPETLVTMRHEGAAHDSFKPMHLRVPAAAGEKRAETRAKLARLRERTAAKPSEVV